MLVEGQFSGSGGSNARPVVGALTGVVLEARDLPRQAIARLLAELPGSTLISDVDLEVTRRRLERSALLERLAELDVVLATLTGPAEQPTAD